ncbi:uncharacterized protein LOC143294894 [Babylonia areolata]|uniref:uncharacterized protein LOC143294894 n=1 Tax=Babylonia areolata TaxID=304850 RepID=UPI003FCF3B04
MTGLCGHASHLGIRVTTVSRDDKLCDDLSVSGSSVLDSHDDAGHLCECVYNNNNNNNNNNRCDLVNALSQGVFSRSVSCGAGNDANDAAPERVNTHCQCVNNHIINNNNNNNNSSCTVNTHCARADQLCDVIREMSDRDSVVRHYHRICDNLRVITVNNNNNNNSNSNNNNVSQTLCRCLDHPRDLDSFHSLLDTDTDSDGDSDSHAHPHHPLPPPPPPPPSLQRVDDRYYHYYSYDVVSNTQHLHNNRVSCRASERVNSGLARTIIINNNNNNNSNKQLLAGVGAAAGDDLGGQESVVSDATGLIVEWCRAWFLLPAVAVLLLSLVLRPRRKGRQGQGGQVLHVLLALSLLLTRCLASPWIEEGGRSVKLRARFCQPVPDEHLRSMLGAAFDPDRMAGDDPFAGSGGGGGGGGKRADPGLDPRFEGAVLDSFYYPQGRHHPDTSAGDLDAALGENFEENVWRGHKERKRRGKGSGGRVGGW